jgi:hypothetical protein
MEVSCNIHSDWESYRSVSPSKEHQDSVGSFYGARGNGSYVGSIHLVENQPNRREIIIHEACHAAFELERHLGRHVTTRYEEAVVQAAAGLAAEMLDCIEDCSI